MSVARRVPLLVLLACCPPAPGKELLPGFALDSCAWHASHVAVVTEGGRVVAVAGMQNSLTDTRFRDGALLPPTSASKRIIRKSYVPVAGAPPSVSRPW